MIKQSRYKLIVSDLDGTILDKTYTFPRELREIIGKAKAHGCEITFATGRLYPSAVQFAHEIGITVPLITYNGALIRDPVSGETVCEKTLDRSMVQEILRLTDGHSLLRFVFKEDAVYTDTPEAEVRSYANALKVRFVHEKNLAGMLDQDPIMLTLRGAPTEIAKWTACLKEMFKGQLYMANSRPFFLDISDPGVSKGSALKFLAGKLGVDLSQTIAIGDERNDLELMATAGLGAAVGNAADVVKQTADYVAEGEYWRGVIEIIDRFVL